MNIIYIGSFRFPSFDAAAARVLNNSKAITKAGHQVLVISWGGAYRDKDLCEDGKYRIDGSIEYIVTNELDTNGGFFSKMKNFMKRGRITIGYLKTLHCQPDIIILYNATNEWTRKMMNYCIRHQIFIVHDITEWYSSNELYFFQWIPNWLNMTVTQHKIKNKILISTWLNHYYERSNNLLIPPLCDRNESKWTNTLDEDVIPSFDGITLIYAGVPGKKDSLHTVIKVVNRLAYKGKPIRLLILGCELNTYYASNRKFLEDSNLHENILFLGRVSQDLVPAYYKKSDFMVLLRESTRKNMAGFPTKVAEAITAGVPVITNNTSDLPKYIHDGQNGFILKSCDEKSLYNLLLYKVLPLSEEERIRMKKHTTDSSKSFNYETYINEFDSFIKNLK